MSSSPNVTLISSDGEEFDVELCYLMAGSKFFHNLFSDTSLGASPHEPIPLDVPSPATRLFIAWLRHESASIDLSDYPSPMSYHQLLHMLELWRKYDSVAVQSRLEILLHIPGQFHFGSDFWKFFLMAAQLESVPLAQAVIRALGPVSGVRDGKVPVDKLQQLPRSWMAALVNAGYVCWWQWCSYGGVDDWRGMAHAFGDMIGREREGG